MKKFRNLPAVFTLLSGFIVSVRMIIDKYTLKDFMWILVCVMVGFYLLGAVFRFFLDKIYRKEEEKEKAKQEELKKKQEEEEALSSEQSEDNHEVEK